MKKKKKFKKSEKRMKKTVLGTEGAVRVWGGARGGPECKSRTRLDSGKCIAEQQGCPL